MKQLPRVLALLLDAEQQLAEAWREMAERHSADYEVARGGKLFFRWSNEDAAQLEQMRHEFESASSDEATVIRAALFRPRDEARISLLRDIQDMLALAHYARAAATALELAAKVLQHEALGECVLHCSTRLDREIGWLQTHLKNAAPQALLVN